MIENKIICVFGRKGCGKTYRANEAARRLVRRGCRVIVLAPRGGFDLMGSPVIYTAGELARRTDLKRSFVMIPSDDTASAAFLLYARITGNCWVVIDEVDLYCSAVSSDENLRQIIRYGRHSMTNLITCCQRPANVARDLTAMSDALVLFNSDEPNDMAYLSRRMPSAVVERVFTLPDREFILYHRGRGVHWPSMALVGTALTP